MGPVWSAACLSVYMGSPFPARLGGSGEDSHYQSVEHRASAAIICLKCRADFHYTSSIPDIPGWQGRITGKRGRGGSGALTDWRLLLPRRGL